MQIVLVSCELIYFHKEFSALRQYAHDILSATYIRMAHGRAYRCLYIYAYIRITNSIFLPLNEIKKKKVKEEKCRRRIHLSPPLHFALPPPVYSLLLIATKMARRCRHRIHRSIQSYTLSHCVYKYVRF